MESAKIEATVLILAKNEERHIGRAVESVVPYFKEVIVVDSGSVDRTPGIAANAGADVVNYMWDGRYPKKKEWSLDQASFDWVLYLDADEFILPPLIEEISLEIAKSDVSAIEVPLSYFFLGQELFHGHQVRKRIGMRRSAAYWPRPDDLHVKNMWEVEGHYQPQITKGRVVTLEKKLSHSDEDGLYDYFARHNRYSDWEAIMLSQKDFVSTNSRSFKGRLAARLPAKPVVFFVYSYLIRRGFLDGRRGLHYAVALSFYYWQIGVKRLEAETARTAE